MLFPFRVDLTPLPALYPVHCITKISLCCKYQSYCCMLGWEIFCDTLSRPVVLQGVVQGDLEIWFSCGWEKKPPPCSLHLTWLPCVYIDPSASFNWLFSIRRGHFKLNFLWRTHRGHSTESVQTHSYFSQSYLTPFSWHTLVPNYLHGQRQLRLYPKYVCSSRRYITAKIVCTIHEVSACY